MGIGGVAAASQSSAGMVGPVAGLASGTAPLAASTWPPAALGPFLAHWWVFPVSVVFSGIALSSGVSGALFFSPFFMLVVGLAPSEAVVAGALLAHRMDLGLLKAVFGVGLLVLAGFLTLYSPRHESDEPAGTGVTDGGQQGGGDVPADTTPRDAPFDGRFGGVGETVVEARDGPVYRYPTCFRLPGVALATAGAFVTGLISAGLPEVVTTQR